MRALFKGSVQGILQGICAKMTDRPTILNTRWASGTVGKSIAQNMHPIHSIYRLQRTIIEREQLGRFPFLYPTARIKYPENEIKYMIV